jgi:hypothetical protein
MSQSSFLLATSNDVWRVIGSFFVFTRHELTQVFPFVSTLFRLRAREIWSKFGHKSVFKVYARLNNWQWITSHSNHILRLRFYVLNTPTLFQTATEFPNVKTLGTDNVSIIQNCPRVRKLFLTDPEDSILCLERRFIQVRRLFLSWSGSEVLQCFPNLEHLKLHGLTSRILNDDIKSCPNLQWLRIEHCPKLQHIEIIKYLTSLTGLYVDHCDEMRGFSSVYNLDWIHVDNGTNNNVLEEAWVALEYAAWKQKTHGAQ